MKAEEALDMKTMNPETSSAKLGGRDVGSGEVRTFE